MKGRNVCILGKLANVSIYKCSKRRLDVLIFKFQQQSDSQFEITSADNLTVLIKLKMPIRDTLSDIIEVYGTVDAKGHIICTNYATFDDQVISKFGINTLSYYIYLYLTNLTIKDMELYNETLDMMTQMPKYYIQASSY